MDSIVNETMEMDHEQMLGIAIMEAITRVLPASFHELNNKMTSISGYSELMLMDKSISKQAASDLKNLQEAAQQGEKLIAVIRELFSDLNEADHVTFNIEKAIDDLTILLAKLLSSKNVKIEFKNRGMNEKVIGSRKRFMISLVMLMIEIIGIIPRGGCIRIDCHKSSENSICVEIKTLNKTCEKSDIPDHIESLTESICPGPLNFEMCECSFQKAGGKIKQFCVNEDTRKYEIEMQQVKKVETGFLSVDMDLKSSLNGWTIRTNATNYV